MIGAVMLGICPALLLGFSVLRGSDEHILGMSSLSFGLILIAGGFAVYFMRGPTRLATSFVRTHILSVRQPVS